MSSHPPILTNKCFNSRTPGGVRRRTQPHIDIEVRVSIHAPREGCDLRGIRPSEMRREFQFTHPGRGATIHPNGWAMLLAFQFTHPGRGATLSAFSVM